MESLKRTAYFVSETETDTWYGKPVFPLEHLKSENKDNIVIIVADSKYYNTIAPRLVEMGFQENLHFYNGWKLPEAYFINENNDEWQNYEKSDTFEKATHWNERAEIMSAMIPDDVKSIVDFGCGNQRLKNYLKPNIKYIGLDYIARSSEGEDMIVCDVNKENLPVIQADCAYMAGFLPYVKNLENFFKQLNFKYLLFSYAGREMYNLFDSYRSRGMPTCLKNYKCQWEVIQITNDNGYKLIKMNGRNFETICLLEKDISANISSSLSTYVKKGGGVQPYSKIFHCCPFAFGGRVA